MTDTPNQPAPRRALPLTRYQLLVLAMAGLPAPPRIVSPPGSNTTGAEQIGGDRFSEILQDEHRLVDLERPAEGIDGAVAIANPFSMKLALGMRSEKPRTAAQQQARKKAKASRKARKANRR